ncbi:hypothetical protein Avbf_12609 [Armadillidium vulgare]|nr:hypothetical protein Avbf_12609 [Armadillidium vulgare]
MVKFSKLMKFISSENSSRFAIGKLVTSIGIKETEKDSVTQEKGTKLFSVKHYQIFITYLNFLHMLPPLIVFYCNKYVYI